MFRWEGLLHAEDCHVELPKMLVLTCMILGDEPLSPQSDARAKGLHYTVKERRYGYECLICGLLGDIRWIRSSPCKPKDAPVDDGIPETGPQEEHHHDMKARQELQDEAMARELHQLQVEEQELQQMLTLQQLEHEENGFAVLAERKASTGVGRSQCSSSTGYTRRSIDPEA